MTVRCLVWTVLAVGCLAGYGFASPSYSTTFTREQRATERSFDAPTPRVVASPSQITTYSDPREGRHLILETLSAIAALKLGKRIGQQANSVQNWFANPFNVTVSVGVGNNTSGYPTYNPTPIYNAFPITSDPNFAGAATSAGAGAANVNYGGSASALLYRGEACNANTWPACSTGVTPCNDNTLPACYFEWPSCNSNVLPNCNAVLAGVACNNNTLPYCVDAGVPCNSNDLNFCINAPSPCNDNNWPYCPGFGALAASFNGVVNGVVNSGVNGGVNGGLGSTGPNGAFFSPNNNAAVVNAGTLGVNGAFFSPSNKVGPLGDSFVNGQVGNNAAMFVKNTIMKPIQDALANVSPSADGMLVAKPTIENLSGGLYDLLAQTNSTPPWTFELTRPNRMPKPTSADAVQKYVVAIAPMLMPTLGMEAVTALADAQPPQEDYNDYRSAEDMADVGGESMFGDDFGLQLFGENRVKPDRDPRKPNGVHVQNKTYTGVVRRKNWKAAKKPFDVKHSNGKYAKHGSGNSTVRTPVPRKTLSSHKPTPGSLVGLPEKFLELAKISKVTFGAATPSKRSSGKASVAVDAKPALRAPRRGTAPIGPTAP